MVTNLSCSTDYFSGTEKTEYQLKKIAEAGFTHVHWCHHWNTDYLYSDSEINKNIKILDQNGLTALDIHASEGDLVNWISKDEDLRAGGIDLVKNRIHMANRFGSDAIVLHFKREPEEISERQEYWEIMHRSLDVLEPYSRKKGVKIALENYQFEESKEIRRLFTEYDSNFLGLCYDSGHGNMGDGLKTLEELGDRLLCVHLHDNNGRFDEHKIPFSGTLDWDRFAKILVNTSYEKCLNLEVMKENMYIMDDRDFLRESYDSGMKLTELVKKHC